MLDVKKNHLFYNFPLSGRRIRTAMKGEKRREEPWNKETQRAQERKGQLWRLWDRAEGSKEEDLTEHRMTWRQRESDNARPEAEIKMFKTQPTNKNQKSSQERKN